MELAEQIVTRETDEYSTLVAQVLDIEDITRGDPKQGYLVRYRGRLRLDSVAAYDQLADALRPLEITPLFRKDEGRHAVLLMPGIISPTPSKPWLNVVLFGLTLLSVIFAGALSAYDGPAPTSTWDFIRQVLLHLGPGVPFAVSLLSILLAHEFGHYLAGRYHNTVVTLPYFIPFPLSPFGTMGAVIQLKEPPKNRRILLDIGVAGPLAGMMVAIPVLFIGLALSKVGPVSIQPGQGFQLEGNSLFYLLSKFLVFGRLLPVPANYASLNHVAYWLRFFFTSQPLPIGGYDVMIHPIAFAGWAGLLVTGLNLIPAGQLDGGHLLYVLFGKRARVLLPFILVGLLLLSLAWVGWLLLAFLIFVFGRLYAEPLDQITTLDPRRKAIAILGLVIFILVFTPVPLVQSIIGG